MSSKMPYFLNFIPDEFTQVQSIACSLIAFWNRYSISQFSNVMVKRWIVFIADSRKFSPRTSATLQRNKSALSTKGGKNDRSKTKESKVLIEISEAAKLQPLPDVTIDVAICLHSWKTAKEAQDWINEMSVSDWKIIK